MANFYQILGLPNFASISEVRKSFRKMAVQYHPDKHGGQKIYEEKFKSINLAYQTLGDARKKDIYDQKLLYANTNTFKTTPDQQQSTNKPKTGRKYEPIIKDTPKGKKRKPKELKHTKFQKQLMTSFLVIVPVFIALGIWLNYSTKNKSPHLELTQINQNLVDQVENKLNSPHFLQAIPYIDSLEFINKNSYQNEQLRYKLFKKQATLINDLIKDNKHSKIIKESLVLHNLSEKYDIKTTPRFSLNLANSYFETGKSKEGVRTLKNINEENLSIKNRFFLSDILLKNDFLLDAEITIKKNKTALFNLFFNNYGANFYESLKSVKLEDKILKELVQFVCVNANTDKKSYSLLHDFISSKLKGTAHEVFYTDLLNKDFLKRNIDTDFKRKHEKSITYFNLKKYYP